MKHFARRAGKTMPLVLVVLSVLLLAGLAWWRAARDSRHDRTAGATKESPRRPAAGKPRSKPKSRHVRGFVGSAACATCHAEIAETYKSHPMSLSFTPEPAEPSVESYDRDTQFQALRSPHTYRVTRDGGRIVHHELLLDEQGETLYDQAVPVAFAIGSGTRGCTYAVNRQGILTVSPISWFTLAHEKKWNLSPGYASERDPGFDRRVTEDCLLCHAGRYANASNQADVFAQEPILEFAIGCERCHGPGEKHVKLHQSGTAVTLPDRTIVHPGRLPPRERESICNQCHLEGRMRVARYAQRLSDFQPGMSLENLWSVLVVPEESLASGSARAVSQAEQMVSSTCFQASEGRMGCTSCHDPHRSVASKTHAEQSEFYRDRCLTCHEDPDCTASPESRASVENSCIDCHMRSLSDTNIAHAAQTDHRIQRREDPVDASPRPRVDPRNLAFFDGADQRMQAWEVDRARGIQYVAAGVAIGEAAAEIVDEGAKLLLPARAIHPDDVLTLESLGAAAMSRGRPETALKFWREALAIDPKHERILNLAAGLTLRSEQFEACMEYNERLLTINPWGPVQQARRATLLDHAGKLREAIQAAEKSLELDPGQLPLREWLVDACQRANRHARAEQERILLGKMKQVLNAEPPRPSP